MQENGRLMSKFDITDGLKVEGSANFNVGFTISVPKFLFKDKNNRFRIGIDLAMNNPDIPEGEDTYISSFGKDSGCWVNVNEKEIGETVACVSSDYLLKIAKTNLSVKKGRIVAIKITVLPKASVKFVTSNKKIATVISRGAVYYSTSLSFSVPSSIKRPSFIILISEPSLQ